MTRSLAYTWQALVGELKSSCWGIKTTIKHSVGELNGRVGELNWSCWGIKDLPSCVHLPRSLLYTCARRVGELNWSCWGIKCVHPKGGLCTPEALLHTPGCMWAPPACPSQITQQGWGEACLPYCPTSLPSLLLPHL